LLRREAHTLERRILKSEIPSLRKGFQVETGPSEDDASESLASDIEKLRQKIASAMGMLPSEVRLSVEFLSG
jgi:flagellar biosynthesis component FlhA